MASDRWTSTRSSNRWTSLPRLDSKLRRLPQSITVGSTTVSASYIYWGNDASVASWPEMRRTSGLTLSQASSGTDPLVNQSSAGIAILGRGDQYAKVQGGDVWQGANGTGDIALEDFVLETVFQSPTSASPRIVATCGAANGYEIKIETSGTVLRATVVSGAGTTQPTSSGALLGGHWYHVMAFADRSEASANGWRFYVNGQAAPATSGHDISAHVANSLAGSKLTLGSRADFAASTTHTGGIAWAAMWKSSAWHPGGASNLTAWAAIALARFSLLQ